MATFLTRQQAADRAGVSPSQIDNMVQAGKLRRVARGLFNADDVDIARAGMDPVKRAIAATTKEARSAGRPDQPEGAAADAEPVIPEMSPDLRVVEGGKKGEFGPALVKARTANEVYKARTAELDFKQRSGALIERDAAKRTAADASRLIVQRMRTFPTRLGPQVASMTDANECIALIEDEVRKLIEEFQEMLASI